MYCRISKVRLTEIMCEVTHCIQRHTDLIEKDATTSFVVGGLKDLTKSCIGIEKDPGIVSKF